MTLAEFLLARIAEDEDAARAANGPRWASGDGKISRGGLYALDGDTEDGWAIAWFQLGVANESRQLPRFSTVKLYAHENAVHAALHDPARVLAECEAKRRIVAWDASVDYGAVRFLATVYADHPDYRAEWRP